jgi:hypothetical protein
MTLKPTSAGMCRARHSPPKRPCGGLCASCASKSTGKRCSKKVALLSFFSCPLLHPPAHFSILAVSYLLRIYFRIRLIDLAYCHAGHLPDLLEDATWCTYTRSCHTVVTLLSPCCHTVVTLLYTTWCIYTHTGFCKIILALICTAVTL